MNTAPPRVAALDGLRAFAVLGVLLFHAHLPGAELGWSGVELFYVLSGFLITGILLDTRDQPRYFRTFYARRALRILPAYYAVVALSAGAVLFGKGSLGTLPYYLVYAQNYYPQIASRFTVGVPLLGHTWTLAIEEQFYWLWPLAVSVLRGRRLVIVLVAAMCIAPVARLLFLSLTAGNPYAALSALPSQLDLLASGAIVAVAIRSAVPAGTIIRAGQAASALGALLLVALVLSIGFPNFGETTAWASRPISVLVLSAMALLFGGIVANVAAGGPTLRTVLSFAPLAHIGRISYGLYLYWPIASFLSPLALDPSRPIDPSVLDTDVPVQLLGIALTFLFAELSFRYLETPILRLKRHFPSATAVPVIGERGAGLVKSK